jgi:hypothetical protein
MSGAKTLTFQAFPSQNSELWLTMHSRFQSELSRRDPNDLLSWTLAHWRIRGKPMRLTPALCDLYNDKHPYVVLQKGAQVGGSEWLANTAVWAADTGQGDRGNSLYLMPTEHLMADFTATRINRALAESDYLQQRLREASGRSVDRLGLKAIGRGNVFFRGSDSPRQVLTVDADMVGLDEFDRMSPDVLALAFQRLGSSSLSWLRIASTPTLAESGINQLYLQSDQRHYLLPCPSCKEWQPLEWPQNIDFERHLLVCRHCHAPIDLWLRGEWVAQAPGNEEIHGYHLNRLYSPLANIAGIIRESQALSFSDEQQFQNQVLGEVYAPEGSRLTMDLLDRCRQEYDLNDFDGQSCNMGVDVGKQFHVAIRERLVDRKKVGRLWFAGTVGSIEDLELLFLRFNVKYCVIDSQPETHYVRLLAQRHPSVVYLASYVRNQPGHVVVRRSKSGDANYLMINRTEALDELTKRIRDRQLFLPRTARKLGSEFKDGVGDYYRHLLTLRRTREQDAHGNWTDRWTDNGRPDHFAHAELYCMLAREAGPNGRFLGVYRF